MLYGAIVMLLMLTCIIITIAILRSMIAFIKELDEILKK